MERLSHEFDAVGFYLSGHPLDQYERVLQKLGVKRYAEFEAMTERGSCAGQLAGIVMSARERKSQRGNKFAFGMFSDTTGQFEAVIFSDTLAQCGDLLELQARQCCSPSSPGATVHGQMRIEGVESLDKAAAGRAARPEGRARPPLHSAGRSAGRLAHRRCSVTPEAGGKARSAWCCRSRTRARDRLVIPAADVCPRARICRPPWRSGSVRDLTVRALRHC
jgi:DNA polymerase-3 subunit alpha